METVGIAKKDCPEVVDEFRFGSVVDHDHKSQIYDIRK